MSTTFLLAMDTRMKDTFDMNASDDPPAVFFSCPDLGNLTMACYSPVDIACAMKTFEGKDVTIEVMPGAEEVFKQAQDIVAKMNFKQAQDIVAKMN